MDIFNFVKKLLPRIERRSVEEDLRTTEKEAASVVLPSWDAAAIHFKTNKLASDEAETLSMKFYQNFDLQRASKGVSFVHDIQRRLPQVHKNIVFLQDAIEKHLERDIISEGMTVKSAFVMRSASHLSLVTRYLMSLLSYLYTVEAKHFDVSIDPAMELPRAELKYVEQNFIRFVKLFSDYTQPLNEIVAEVPDVFVAQQGQGMVTGLYGSKFDPFEKTGIAGFIGNPIYSVRMLVAKWQNDRYESAKAKKQQLELRLLYLQMQKEDKVDPVVVKEIERLQMRIENYDRYLREVEESVAEDR